MEISTTQTTMDNNYYFLFTIGNVVDNVKKTLQGYPTRNVHA